MILQSFKHRGTKVNVHFHDAFEEAKHPRAKAGKTAGRFVKKGEEGKQNETVHGPGSTGQSAEEQSRPNQGRSTGGSGGNGVRSDGLDIKSTFRPKGDTDEHHVFHEVEVSHHAARKYCNYITKAKNSSKYGAAVHVYEPEDYAKMRLFLNPDASAGFALKGDDIISVFKDKTGPLGACRAILDIATAQGGRRLDCFDTVLPAMYNQSGFQAVARMPFDDEYKPEGWDYDTFGKYKGGRPDVVFMVYDPDNKKMYEPGDGETITDYDDGEKYQKKALEGELSSSYPLAPKSEWYGEANYENTGGKMQEMSPDEFLKQARPLDIDEVSRENIDDLKQHIQAGKTLDPLILYPNGKEDGRHRANAAKELGITKVPVISFRGKARDILARVFKLRDTKVFLHFHDFEETQHPRAKSGSTAGQFVKKGESGKVGTVGSKERQVGPTTATTSAPKPKAAPGAVVVNPIALILKKYGYEKQKGSNIYKHPSGHEIEVHAASEGQKWLTGWTHSAGSTGSGAGRLDTYLQSIHSKTPTPTPTPKTTPPPPPKAVSTTTTTIAKGAKPPSGSKEDEESRKKHQERIKSIVKDGYGTEYPTLGTAVVPSPAKVKKMLTDVTGIIYDYMGVEKKHVPFTVGRMGLAKIGSRKFRPGGHFVPNENKIKIGTNNHPATVGGLAAHEIMHAKFQALKKAYKEEGDRISKDNRGGDKWIMRPSGEIREEYQADYPIHTLMPDGFGGNVTDLAADDGITNYSREWWKAYKDGKADLELAVNETLAEMANLDWKGELSNLTWFKESKTYKPFYEAIHKLYPAVVSKSEKS